MQIPSLAIPSNKTLLFEKTLHRYNVFLAMDYIPILFDKNYIWSFFLSKRTWNPKASTCL